MIGGCSANFGGTLWREREPTARLHPSDSTPKPRGIPEERLDVGASVMVGYSDYGG